MSSKAATTTPDKTSSNSIHPSSIIDPHSKLGHEITVEPMVYVGPNTTLEDHSVLEAHCVIREGVRVGRGARIRSGSVVTRNVPDNAIAEGNPARIVGYVNTDLFPPAPEQLTHGVEPERRSIVQGVRFFRFPVIHDLRGDLTVAEFGKQLPFLPKRYFIVLQVPGEEVRGEHAHHTCEQVLVCVQGRVSVLVDDGTRREEFLLDHPTQALYIPPKVWGVQYKYSKDGVLVVFASHPYDPKDYIRNYQDFIKLVKPSS